MRRKIDFLKLAFLTAITVIIFVCGENQTAYAKEDTQQESVEGLELYQFGDFPESGEIQAYSEDELLLEEAVYNSLNNMEEGLEVGDYAVLKDDFKTVCEKVINNHPELFYVSNSYRIMVVPSTTQVISVAWNYVETDKAVIQNMKERMAEHSRRILSCITNDMTDVEKLMVIHDALIMNTEYSFDTDWNPDYGCYTSYCTLVEGRGVCQGYSLAFMYLASEAGMDTRFVTSRSLNHAWNFVQAEGTWYHVDATWDDNGSGNGGVSHRNFLLSDTGIRNTGHTAWDDPTISSYSERFDNYYWRAMNRAILHGTTGWIQLPEIIPENGSVVFARTESGIITCICRNAGTEIQQYVPETEAQYIAEHLVIPWSDFSLNYEKLELTEGESADLHIVSYVPENTTDGEEIITWRSSDPETATVEEGIVYALAAGSTVISAECYGIKKQCMVTVKEAPEASVRYSTHIQDIGWQVWKENGTLSGTSGQAKRLEAIKIGLSGGIGSGGVEYRTHVQDYGWQGWKTEGEMSGTAGESKRLEAIQIQLIGSKRDYYDIYYRVHVQDYGWLDWAKNGERAGTAGLSKRLEAIQVVLVRKDEKAPGNREIPFIEKLSVNYQTHVQDYGWQNYVSDGAASGTVGKAKRLEGLRVRLANHGVGGCIEYRSHVQDYGWQGYVTEGALSGTSGEAKRLEAVQIRLTGELAKRYNIYYRVQVQDYGWLGWARNGESAGTAGLGKRLESIQIKIMPKGENIVSSRSFIVKK